MLPLDATETVDEFADRLGRWLDENIEPRAIAGARNTGDPQARAQLDALNRRNQAQLYQAGFAGPSVPREYGGLGLPEAYQEAYAQRVGRHGLRGHLPTALPALLAWASEEFKLAHVPAILAGKEIWVLLLSEPTGGSDLAGVSTVAIRDGDELVIRGQKVWSSGAQFADFGLCLTRTDPSVPKHRGLTMVAVPMRTPGVTARSIRQVTADTDFCEVFLDDVRVPMSNIIGTYNGGWAVAGTQMTEERTSAGLDGRAAFLDEVVAYVRQRYGDAPGADRELSVARMLTRYEVEKHLIRRVREGIAAGAMKPSSTALIKLARVWRAQANAKDALDLVGVDGIAWAPDAGSTGARWSLEYLGGRGLSIGGGTTEMLRNLVAERVLGLPKEARADLDRPFSETLRNTLPPRERD